MAKWVVDKGKKGQKRGVKDKSILKSLAEFSFYTTFLFLLYYIVLAP